MWKTMRKKAIPDEIRKVVEERLNKHVREKYAKYDIELIMDFRGPYCYIDYEDWETGSHLCRMKYNGKMDTWDMEIYKYSDECYDEDRDYLSSGGTVEECFDEAARLYITETFS